MLFNNHIYVIHAYIHTYIHSTSTLSDLHLLKYTYIHLSTQYLYYHPYIHTYIHTYLNDRYYSIYQRFTYEYHTVPPGGGGEGHLYPHPQPHGLQGRGGTPSPAGRRKHAHATGCDQEGPVQGILRDPIQEKVAVVVVSATSSRSRYSKIQIFKFPERDR